MKILAHCHRLDRTGAPIILHRLIRDLVKRHKVSLLKPAHGNLGSLVQDYAAIGVEMLPSASTSEFDVVLANTMMSSGVIMSSHKRMPCLYWVHEPKGGLPFITEKKSYPEAFNLATRVVFPTLWQARSVYAPYLQRDNWRVVPYGIGVDESPQPAPFKRRPGALYLMHTGMLCSRKGQDVTLAALDRLPDLDIEVFMAGDEKFDPDFTAKLRSFVDSRPHLAGRVHITGSLAEAQVNAHIQACDALIFPTRDDLITLAILEGLLFGKCILSSDYGPIPETIRHLDTGLLSPVNDATVLAENIRTIFHDRRLMTQLGQSGRRIYDEKHSFPAHVANMELMLQEAIAIGRGA